MGKDGENVVILGGGVGPMAGVAAHARVIESTLSGGDDQSHLTVVHLSRSSAIPDRTEYLLAFERGERPAADPASGMAGVFAAAVRALKPGETAVGGIPCNTFHAPPIFDRFLRELADRAVPVRIVHMLRETVSLLRLRLGGGKGCAIGVLSTTGTRRSRVYDTLLEEAGFRIRSISENDQPLLHQAIYDPVWGIKAVSPPSERAAETVARFARDLADAGVAAIVPACTELPLVLPGDVFAGVPLVDPVLALARGLVREAAPAKLRPLATS